MRNGLGVIPDMGARAVTAPPVIRASFEAPQSAVCLSEHCWRFEDSQVGSDSLDHFVRKSRVIEGISEQSGLITEKVIFEPPIIGDLVNVLELAGIPGNIVGRRTAGFPFRFRDVFRIIAVPDVFPPGSFLRSKKSSRPCG
jgi:hypothetical protein